ncbi:putative 3-hydroxybutyryl-CoA dehydrogenase [Clostridium homopropionicum DSM 5847]|uniref:Putative 3-hydroxybutyryl-CoA dehydrogenase n=1 Tax=Clostridium homopropionicum DSM 5847 TaxID=1121318 RepID=A0A0L6Z593_9CLOT|nr:3-hydroxyacyl-CoA dehydrogenase family protein [Clostridium homopropionicum]KOA18130.1 putative 3-hydroxybutyryl-CoA dehydrogenase [Clostridium homopropionicum DSM 5847]SFG96408.1 3-hydroxybutyryl-CoA dehydrogenase [Clostridium homopropionicum]
MIKKIGILGAGTMGHGIAETFAMYGYNVNLFEVNDNVRNSVKEKINEDLQVLAEEELIEKNNIPEILDKIKLFSDLKLAVEDRDYVIEAVPEIMDLKQKIFKSLDEYCPKHTILASNTSSLKLDEMMENVSEERKKRMIVNHWYNPAHLMPIAEMSFFGNMPEEIYKEVEELYSSIGKQTVKVLKDVPGLVANRIQQGVAREVFSLIEMGVALPGDIDKALKFGPAFRYATTGQLEIADFGGLDIWCTVSDNLLSVMDNSKCANQLLRNKVQEGKLGIKSGEGFYNYSGPNIEEVKKKYLKKLIHQLKASKYYI